MRTLLFDIDGTLLLTNRGGSGALKLAIEQAFDVPVARTDIRFSGRTDRALLIEILERNGVPPTVEHQTVLANLYLELLPGVLNQHGGQLMPGTLELLDRIAGCDDLLCYVMTGNMRQSGQQKLDHFGLLHYFADVFGGDHDVDRNRLAQRTAADLCERHGPEVAESIVVIGDTPADIRCGRAIGADVIAVCTGNFARAELEAEGPTAVIDDMSDVAAVFQLLTDPNRATID